MSDTKVAQAFGREDASIVVVALPYGEATLGLQLGSAVYDKPFDMQGKPSKGLTLPQAQLLKKLQTLAEDAAEAASDAGCLHVQEALGIADGGFAAMFFSGSEEVLMKKIMLRYIAAEIENGEVDLSI